MPTATGVADAPTRPVPAAIFMSWTRPYTPRTNGKAERFIRTCLEHWAYAAAYRSSRERDRLLPEWLPYYNSERPHTALTFQTPTQRLADRS